MQLDDLEHGRVRAATCDAQGQWQANSEVKSFILTCFRQGNLAQQGDYVDKHNLPLRQFTPQDQVRLVPRGSAVRRGAYVASGVIIMPPSYINIGAYVDSGTMVDSHVLVGSCAQIGKQVHLSAGVQIGGVLEPVNATPVIIEDHCFIGAGCIVVDGVIVRRNAVLAPGVRLSSSIPVYDCVHEQALAPGSEIPANAVVVPGSRPASHAWAQAQGLQMQCALIVKYRDEQTNVALILEQALR
jgi:2,3,4,5-tetrahydropyridine-2-carboxylate N-succinyltransferase